MSKSKKEKSKPQTFSTARKDLGFCIPHTQSSVNLFQVPALSYTLESNKTCFPETENGKFGHFEQIGGLHSKDIDTITFKVHWFCSFWTIVTQGHLVPGRVMFFLRRGPRSSRLPGRFTLLLVREAWLNGGPGFILWLLPRANQQLQTA